MDTRNWFGEHAATVKLIALVGGIALAVIVLLDMFTHKSAGSATTTGAAPATGADTSPATSGESATSTLPNPGQTYISILEDYSSHVNNDLPPAPPTTLPRVTSGPLLPGHVMGVDQPNALVRTVGTPVLAPVSAPVSSPTSTGGATVPVPTPHPAQQYTVKSGDTLFGIAQRFLGNGADWQELFNWNRSAISNPNLIYPGEVLTV